MPCRHLNTASDHQPDSHFLHLNQIVLPMSIQDSDQAPPSCLSRLGRWLDVTCNPANRQYALFFALNIIDYKLQGFFNGYKDNVAGI